MTTNNNETSTGTALSVRQEKMLAVRDEMTPGAKPRAIVPANFAEVIVMCQALAAADLAPKNLRGKATDMALVIMTGAEVGLPPMASLRLYTTWDGVPRLMAEGVRAIILQSPEIEYFEMATCDDNHATWIGKRRGRPEKSVTWTTARAQAAGLLDKENWRKYRQDMFNARASMQLGRILAPDVVAGMVALEEARDGDFIDAQAVESKPVFAAPPPRTVEIDASKVSHGGVGTMAAVRDTPNGPQAVTVTPTGTQPSEQQKRNGGKKSDRPTPATPANNGSVASSPASGTTGGDARPTTPASAPTPSPQPSASTSPAADGSTSGAAPAASSPTDRWGQSVADPTSSAGSSSSSTTGTETSEPSETRSTASTASAPVDDFGAGEDPVDAAPAVDPVAAKLDEFRAFLAGCKSQGEMQRGFPVWRVWTVEMSKTDPRFHRDGALTKLITELWATRKGALPA